MPKIKIYEEDEIPEYIHLTAKAMNIIKVWDYHCNGYFYCKPNGKGIYKWEGLDPKYVTDVDNARSKFSVWFNCSKKRWELFDGDTLDIPLKKKKPGFRVINHKLMGLSITI